MMQTKNKCGLVKATRKIDRIVIHCSATPEGRDFHEIDIERWHRAQGWNGCGYHYVIDLDGKVELGRYINTTGAHASGYNVGSIGICYIGGMDAKNEKAKDTRTPAQKESLLWLICELRKMYPGVKLCGHRDLPNVKKACPCFDAMTEYSRVIKTGV